MPLTETPLTETLAEARRSMEICNACRYCEGYCAVFPAMERRRAFTDGDLGFLANLCHNCKGCYYACQYAPPHAFGLNVPRTFAELRAETYEDHAWPRPMARLFQRNGLVAVLITAFAVAAAMLGATALIQPEALYGVHRGPGAFYAVISHNVMVTVFGAAFLYAILAMAMGLRSFWRASGGGRVTGAALARGLHDAATLKNLGGGGHGCNDLDDGFAQMRRHLHHAMAGGFLLCFASTSLATVYHYAFGWEAPYAWYSPVVLLGTLGGIGLLIGPAGLAWLKFKADRVPGAAKQDGADMALLASLFFVSLTGLVLLVFRDTSAMGMLLVIHLGFVMGLFLVLPYGKFVHGMYRTAALVRDAAEQEAKAAAPAGTQAELRT